MNNNAKAQPVLTVNNDGTLTLHQTLSIGDVLNLLDAARNGVMSIKVDTAQPETEVEDD